MSSATLCVEMQFELAGVLVWGDVGEMRGAVGVADCFECDWIYGEADGDWGSFGCGALEKRGELRVSAPFARGFVGELAACTIDVSRAGRPFAGVGGTEHRDCGWKGAGHIREQIVA